MVEPRTTPPDHRSPQVWYVAYGSNLRRDRFRCYLAGGRPDGGLRTYDGCRDPADPVRDVGVEVPGRLVFGGTSTVWGGGMAFYDARAEGTVAARAYLVTPEQLADVAAQEMRRPAGGEHALRLQALLPPLRGGHRLGPGRYETVVHLGELDALPLLTLTHSDLDDLEPAAPSAAYLVRIASGLRESHGWDPDRVGAYLAAAPGAAGTWTPAAVADLARAAFTRETPRPARPGS